MPLLVDGMNVIGSRPDGWWRDRDGAARRLWKSLSSLAAASGDDISVVFDGRPLPDLPEGRHDGVQVLYARRGGANGADDRMIEELGADPDPAAVTLVTSDRELSRRAQALGATVVGVKTLLARLDNQRQTD